eukprot:2879915-Amphidinium_carterae.1
MMRGLSGGRRLFAGYDLAELTVEELAMRWPPCSNPACIANKKHYLAVEGFQCGIHCEGALLRDCYTVAQKATIARLCRLAEQTPNELANEVGTRCTLNLVCRPIGMCMDPHVMTTVDRTHGLMREAGFAFTIKTVWLSSISVHSQVPEVHTHGAAQFAGGCFVILQLVCLVDWTRIAACFVVSGNS